MSESEKTEFSLEQELKNLRGILDKMQMSNLDFDENIKLFTTGTEKIEACRDYLDRAEMMIKQLIEGKNGLEERDFDES